MDIFETSPSCQPGVICIADVDGDGDVNVNDLLAVIGDWNDSCPPGVICTAADITADGIVNVNDVLAVIANWGLCTSAETAPQSVSDCQSKCAQQYPTLGTDYSNCVEDCVWALCETGQLPAEDCP